MRPRTSSSPPKSWCGWMVCMATPQCSPMPWTPGWASSGAVVTTPCWIWQQFRRFWRVLPSRSAPIRKVEPPVPCMIARTSPCASGGPRVRLIVASHAATSTSASIGNKRDGMVYELFVTRLAAPAFSAKDVLDLYLHRGSFETVLADEDIEQDPDRWCSHTPCGQEFWQILSQWVWNLRLEFGQHVSASPMRLTELAYSQIDEPVQAREPVQASALVKADESVSYGPAQWARRSFTKGFAGADFALQPDGTLRCPADYPLYPQERRAERDGSVRVLYAARIGH